MLVFKILLASVFLNALTAITASDTIPQFSESKNSKSKSSKSSTDDHILEPPSKSKSKSSKSSTDDHILESPSKSKSKSSKSSKSKSKSRDIQYVKAADDVRSDIINRIKTASNPNEKSRGILSHAYFFDDILKNSDCKDPEDPGNCTYDPNSGGDTRNKLLLNTYRGKGPTNGTGIDWNKADGTYFGTVTDSTAKNLIATSCTPDGFIEVNVTDDDGNTTLQIVPPDNIQCDYQQDDYYDGSCMYRPYSGSYANLRDDILPIGYADYKWDILPVGFFVAFDEGGSTDKANPYMTVVDGMSNKRFNNFIADQDPFLCTLQDEKFLGKSITSGRDLAAGGDPKVKQYCEIDCGEGGCHGPVNERSLRYDYQADHAVPATLKNEGPIVDKNGQLKSYVGPHGEAWFDMFINKPCLDAGTNASSCKWLDFRQCAYVRDPDSKLTGDTNKVYDAWLQAKKKFEKKFKKFGRDYHKDDKNKDVLKKILKFTPHAPFNETTGTFLESPYKPLSDKYKNDKPKFYVEASSGNEPGAGLIVESEVPIYMDRLKDAKRLDAPYQRYDRGPSVFGDDFLAVYAWYGNCTEQFGEDAPAFCDAGNFGYGPNKNSSINDSLQNTDFYKLTESTACWTADQISRELGRFVPVMRFKPLHAQITPGALYQWNDKKLTRPEQYIPPDFVNCCDVFMRKDNDTDVRPDTTFARLINDDKIKYYKKDGKRVICPPKDDM